VTGDDTAKLVMAGLMIVLVASSLLGRQLKLGETLRMALVWLALFSIAFVLFLFRDEARGVWKRAQAEVGGRAAETVGGTLRVPMRDDGHFWIEGDVNGTRVDFLVDSGATTTALSVASARAAGIDPTTRMPVTIQTANGAIDATPVRIATLTVGPVRQTNARAVVSVAFGDTNLLGMSFLSDLKSWRVEGRTLILES
jgi:aspartyl protease family protein